MVQLMSVQLGLVLSRFRAAAVVMMVQFVHGQWRHGLHRRCGHLGGGGYHVGGLRSVVMIGTAGASSMVLMLVDMMGLQVVVMMMMMMIIGFTQRHGR